MNANKDVKTAPEYGSDTFSEVLRLLKLDVSIYYNAQMSGKWCVPERTHEKTCFHIVTSGSCMLDVPGHFQGVLEYGDLVIFPKERPHTLYNIQPQKKIFDATKSSRLNHSISAGLLCGEVGFQHRGSSYLLDALPQVFVIRYKQSNNWIGSVLTMIISENAKTGLASKAIFDKLSELLFTYAIRGYISENPSRVGMLAVYGHSRLAKVINSIHLNPDKNWTLESMAKEAALSRTTFSETFRAISGWTAGQYLTWWRMQLAWSLLIKGESISEVSEKVGYKSESAFSHAFHKMFLISAGKVRKGKIDIEQAKTIHDMPIRVY